MQVYNIDETGISVVHKPGKIFSAVGRKYVFPFFATSGEKGKTHTVVVCVSASGHAIPP